jgi:23S rRNA pseudouridine2605 synthase
MRLNRYLAAAGFGSRRHCDELIDSGQVTINGQVCTDFSAQPEESDHVKVKGRRVQLKPVQTIVLHKPAGFVSTRKDRHARDIIYDLLPEKFSNLFNIGRLDAQTEGLILLTNDGALAQRLTHPRFKVEKEYELILDHPWDSALEEKLLRGILLDGQRARLTGVRRKSKTHLQVVMKQGLNRQIRRMFAAVGYEVKRLLRTRIGTIRLSDLPRGHWRFLDSRELRSLTNTDNANR